MSEIKYEWVFDEDSRLDLAYTDFVPGFKHYPSNHMNTKGRNPAKALFEFLGGDCGNRDNPKPPRWEDQPEHLQDIFIRATQPNSQYYHYGMNVVFAVRGDLSHYSYTPATGVRAMEHERKLRGRPSPYKPSEGHKLLRRIEALEDSLETISGRFEDKEARREERRRIKQEIYQLWRRISPKEVSLAILKELYESHVDKGPEVKLPDWMKEDESSTLSAQDFDAFKASLEPEILAEYLASWKLKGEDFAAYHSDPKNPSFARWRAQKKADTENT